MFLEDPIAAFLKRRAAEFNVDNDGAYQTALGWLSECEASHNHCPKQVTGMLPTRVLDLSADNGLERVRLKVTDGETAKYIALSCGYKSWGLDWMSQLDVIVAPFQYNKSTY